MVKVTPLWGGCTSTTNRYAASCTLLEIGSCRILLDCGFSTPMMDKKSIKQSINDLKDNGGIDVILISHGDLEHLGAIPMLFNGENALSLSSVRIICTHPVLKMGQMVLYDYVLNESMEGHEAEIYNFDDIDNVLSSVETVKYNQIVNINSNQNINNNNNNNHNNNNNNEISITALPSGRTIGGSVFLMRFYMGDILYCMDISLSNDNVVNSLKLKSLPKRPALMIMESPLSTDTTASKPPNTQGLIREIMATVRGEGNVLIPCETSAHTQDLLRVLGLHWKKESIGMYHLVFLSPMARNVIDFTRCQLEWMSDSLSEDFYKGQDNPFNLPFHTASSVYDLDDIGPGPKVVLATDPGLSCGLSKELLLRWGGDRRSKVIFTDSYSPPGSLAETLRSKIGRPPMIAEVYKPERVRLKGDELEEFLNKRREAKRQEEEEAQMMRRQSELAVLVAGRRRDDESDNDDEGIGSDEEGEGEANDNEAVSNNDDNNAMEVENNNNNQQVDSITTDTNNNSVMQTPSSTNRRRSSTEGIITEGLTGGVVSTQRKSRRKGDIARFAMVTFPMFERAPWTAVDDYEDDYGFGIKDIFQNNNESERQRQTQLDSIALNGSLVAGADMSSPAGLVAGIVPDAGINGIEEEVHPTKIVTKRIRVQFTCSFVDMPCVARADQKALRAVLNEIRPSRVTILRHIDPNAPTLSSSLTTSGTNAPSGIVVPINQSNYLLEECKKLGIDKSNIFFPYNNATINIPFQLETVQVTLPVEFFNSCVHTLYPAGKSVTSSTNTKTSSQSIGLGEGDDSPCSIVAVGEFSKVMQIAEGTNGVV